MPNVVDVRGLILRCPAFEAAVDFYGGSWGLDRIDHSGGADGAFFRGTGPEAFVLGLVPGPERAIVALRFALESEAAVDAAHRQLSEVGVCVLDEPGPLALPGDYYGFHIADAEGTHLELSAAMRPHERSAADPFRPQRVSHIVLNSSDNAALRDFYTRYLGFRLADWYAKDVLFFLRCNQQHHCLGIERSDNTSLNHVAFHVADLDAMMRCVGRMSQAGYQPLWGPGRHGPGGNCFCYFEDPNGYVVEFTSELIQIADDQTWTPSEWTPGPDNANVWGTGGRTKRAIKLMSGH